LWNSNQIVNSMKTILLIEDNINIRENLAEILELSGYKVMKAEGGKQGVAFAFESTPDIILCDIMMPDLDGYGVIHMIQNNPATQNVPFIFLTAKTERADVRRGMELGADDYITKPFNSTEVLKAIESRLRKSDLLKKDVGHGIEGLSAIISYSGGKNILDAFAEEGHINKFKKKQVIYSEGNHAVRLFYIDKGKVKTYRTNDDGKELVTAIYHEGDFFGYVPILEHTPYKDTAETMEDCEIAVIPRDTFEDLLSKNPDAMKKIVELLAKNVSEKEQQLLGLAYNSLRKKVANAIITVSEKYSNGSKQPFYIDISRDNLATIAGTAKESLIRTLSDFKEEKLIDIVKGDIVVLDEKKLRNLVN